MSAARAHVTPQPLGQSLDRAPFSKLHRRFWLLAALGILLDGFDFFIIGVANPLIAEEFGIGATEKGLVSAAAIVGAVVGAGVLGPLADKIGRRRLFRFDLWLFVVFSLLCVFAWDVWSLIAFRFVLGIAIGLDYPIAASYLAEILPSRDRGRWLVGAFSLQAVGIVLGAGVGVVVLAIAPDVESWRWMLGFGALPALVIIWLRRSTPESPRWLAQNGREQEAEEVAEALVGHPVVVHEDDRRRTAPVAEGPAALIQPALFSRRWRRRTIFTAVPWFLMDVATYGVGIFTPTLLAAMALAGPDATFISDDIASTSGTAALDLFLVLGFVIAIALVEKVGRVRLQLFGFGAMAVALALLALADGLDGGGAAHIWLVVLGFAIFNTFMNAGPNATTYALPAEVFPSDIRAAGHGFAAACAKLGAALGVFLFPILLDDIGSSALLLILAGGCLLALLVTAVFRIETAGRSLEELSGADVAGVSPRVTPP
ncbi:MFS transporter [Conexibacter sp. JD483]|uniref:MFS transporter n=1 Tax=unclassified Conexibacter TaxID=2627773 RepID=UPI00271FBCAD|nr:MULTISPECIES: MFS transporter [unclassified Conexibacter]MDO8183980.1 MFS transporter [Conexibacter sp. CPCC 205706]MDO8196972.1 MFS transporter [Conexibacter sp. CPCC 205762]MDR9369058.1 MFS transporter [Conexibacter sp. JD483]